MAREPDDPAGTARADVVPFGAAVRAWFAISLQTFGGPAGQIAVMQRALVEERRWIGQHRFVHALGYCMLLPGPEAHVERGQREHRDHARQYEQDPGHEAAA